MRWETRVDALVDGVWRRREPAIRDDTDPGAFTPLDGEDLWYLTVRRWHTDDPSPARYRMACYRLDDDGTETLVDAIEIDPSDYAG